MIGRQPLLLVAGVIAFLYFANAAHKLPDDFVKCPVNPDFEECLKTATMDAIRKMKNGRKSLGIIPLDPLSVDEVILDASTEQQPFVLTSRNIKMYGLTDSVVTSLKFDPNKFFSEFTSKTPNLTFTFDYEARGRISVLPFSGKGPGIFVYHNVTTVNSLEGVPYKKGGRTYWNITNYGLDIDAEKLDIVKFEGLLKGNKQVSDQLTEFLRTEWRVFHDLLRKPSAEAVSIIYRDLANRIFSRIPYADVFPGAQQ